MKTYYYNNGTQANPHWSKNWGDIIAPTIVRHFSGSDRIEPTEEKVLGKLVTVGSVMLAVRDSDLVWGTGIIMAGETQPDIGKPKFFAVRGPLTRQGLMQQGHKVPEVYGDPALLYPHIYFPEIEKTHRWGVIPHYIDEHLPIIKELERRGAKVINICAGEREFVDQLLSVERVLSSSLHGLIAADAYGIPNARIILSDRIVGGDYKFIDYANSVKRGVYQGTRISVETDIEKIALNQEIDWDGNRLLAAAPWNSDQYRHLF